MKRKGWLLSAIAHAGEKGLSPIQLQKTMFLLRMEASDYVGQGFYEFEPYNYGPFDSSIYRDTDDLVLSGLVREQESGSYKVYVATPAGASRAARFAKGLPKKPRQYLAALVTWVCSVDFRQLLRAVYAKYPKYAKNSLFRH